MLRQRGEKVERGFARLLVTGGLRPVHVRGQEEIQKRLLVQATVFNLGLLMRKRCGIGTPRGLVATQAALARHAGSAILRLFAALRAFLARSSACQAAGPVLGPIFHRLLDVGYAWGHPEHFIPGVPVTATWSTRLKREHSRSGWPGIQPLNLPDCRSYSWT